MLANAELTQDFNILAEQNKNLVRALLEEVNMPIMPVEVLPTPTGNFRGYTGDQFYVVESGDLVARYQGRTIFVLQAGDMVLPDIAGNSDDSATVYYGSDNGARLSAFPALDFMRRVFENDNATRLWTRMLITYAGLNLRVAAAFVPESAGAKPGFKTYYPGEVIIRQGDRADFVFHMSAGSAEVLVDDVVVGRIGQGEIFGAMAALTHADRSATVRAKTECSVVEVPKEQFTELIKRNPATIHSLLVDMANAIVNLNQQLVSQRG